MDAPSQNTLTFSTLGVCLFTDCATKPCLEQLECSLDSHTANQCAVCFVKDLQGL